MPVKRKKAIRRENGLPEEVEGHFLGDPEHQFVFWWTDKEVRELWERWRDELLAQWVLDNPGTRPRGWWMFDAPENRIRTGGKGTPKFEVLGYVPHFEYGMPTSYVDQWEFEYYNGIHRDVDGHLIDEKRKPGDFVADVYDPDDPPTFESETAYLARLGLFFDGEAKRCH
ncbi:hypothetical protein [Mesorhizobium sp. CN2-181]|uniref:hypothetical protein n=1 Tax=Mesorhizobium yinganensis TaxID=3157707 RepID=UPI0032B835A6